MLLQAKLTSLDRLVVGIEDLRDVLRVHLVMHGAVVVAGIERMEIERDAGFGFPQA